MRGARARCRRHWRTIFTDGMCSWLICTTSALSNLLPPRSLWDRVRVKLRCVHVSCRGDVPRLCDDGLSRERAGWAKRDSPRDMPFSVALAALHTLHKRVLAARLLRCTMRAFTYTQRFCKSDARVARLEITAVERVRVCITSTTVYLDGVRAARSHTRVGNENRNCYLG